MNSDRSGGREGSASDAAYWGSRGRNPSTPVGAVASSLAVAFANSAKDRMAASGPRRSRYFWRSYGIDSRPRASKSPCGDVALADVGEARAGERIVDQRRAESAQCLLRLLVEGLRLGRQGLPAPAGAVQADASAGERIGAQQRRIAALRALADARQRLRIGGGVAGERIQAQRRVVHAAGDRADHVPGSPTAAPRRHWAPDRSWA